MNRAASAEVTYDYYGQPFVKYLTPCVNHTYDCVDGHISGWMTLDLPPDATGRYSGEHVAAFSFTASGTGLTATFSRATDDDAYYALVKHWHFKLDHGRIREWAFFAAFNNGVVAKSLPKSPPEQFFLSSMFPGDQSKNGRKFGHTEVSLAPLMGRWTQRVTPTADISLAEATTLDAESVSVKYSVKRPDLNSVHFDVYRCAQSALNDACKRRLIGSRDVSASSGNNPLSPGTHSMTLLKSADLKPDTAAEFVVVVATPRGQAANETSTTYFRKWMLGIVVHGFHPGTYLGISGDTIVHWEYKMADHLTSIDKYDGAIPFGWAALSAIARPGMAKEAGQRLATGVGSWIRAHARHRGDVVDLHFIGHSRGTVVISQALQQLRTSLRDSVQTAPPIVSGYTEVTLLDPHPANNTLQTPWASWTSDSAYNSAREFQDHADDPAVSIPSQVKQVDVWWQHTDVNDFHSMLPSLNLYGLTTPGALDTGAVPRTNVPLTSSGEFIGHGDVPLVYMKEVVDSARLNHSVTSP